MKRVYVQRLNAASLQNDAATVKCREAGEPTIMLRLVNKGAKPQPLDPAALSASAA